jgi:hypothetical protein
MLWLERKTAYVIRNRTDERTPDSGLVYPRKATREPRVNVNPTPG